MIRKSNNKFTNSQGRMIIQLRTAIFERIRNVQIQALSTVFICLLSLLFLCVFHLLFKRYRRHIVYNDVTCDSVTCYLTLRQFTENRYVKCPVHFFRSNIFLSLSYEQNFLINRIAGKLMNIKKIKLFGLTNTWHILLIQAVNSWRSSEVFIIVCCKCHWTCVLTKCVFLHVVFNGTRVNGSVDFCDSFMWCNHLICKLEWNFTCICKLYVSHRLFTQIIFICHWACILM